MNYLFLAVWVADAWSWRRARVLSPPILWGLRAFYFLIIVNAAVVFATGWRRGLGIAVIAWLAVLWIRDLKAEVRRGGTADKNDTAEGGGARRDVFK